MLQRDRVARQILRRCGEVRIFVVGITVLSFSLPALAGNMLPVFTVSGNYTGAAAVLNSASVFVPGGVLTVQYTVNAGDTAAMIAANLTEALNSGFNSGGNSALPDYFTFTDAGMVGGRPRFVITSAPTPGSAVRSFGAARTTGKGLAGVRVSVAVDPFGGTADFQILGTPNGDGTVTLGIDGDSVSVTPTAGESDVTIMQTLENDLAVDDGLIFNTTDISTSIDDEFTEFHIDTGDPVNGNDIGAFIESDDSGLSTYADVVVNPEPSVIWLVGVGVLVVFVTRQLTLRLRARGR